MNPWENYETVLSGILLLEMPLLIVYDVLMRDLIGKLMILCYCIFSLLFVPVNAEFAAGLFLVVAVSCLLYVFAEWKYVFCISAFYFVLSVFFPVLCAFYPVIFYDIVRKKTWWLCVLFCGNLFYQMLPNQMTQCAFLLLGMSISTYISYQVKNGMQLEEKLIRTQDDSKEKNLLLSEKNRHLIESQNQEIYAATLKERNRIAREIHDHVGHMLSRSILMTGALKAINQQENLVPSLELLENTLHQAMNNVRESVHDLHDDSVDLHVAVEELVGSFTKCKCELDYDMGRFVPNEIKYSMIAIVKESLANIIKHSNATMVRIHMREHPGLYQLIIDDNGQVADSIPSMMDGAKSGMGLSNMKDRVQTLGGNIQFQTEHGFHIFITIPKGEIS